MNFSDNLILSKSVFRPVIIIVLLAILVRVILFFIFNYSHDLRTGDSVYYLDTGRNILVYGVHGEKEIATYVRPPLYSAFAGIVGSISESAVFFYIVQSALFICFSVTIYFLLRRYDNKIAFISALLIAASPFDALLNGRVLSENLVTPLIVLATIAFVQAKNSKLSFFVSGLLLGALVLTRDIYLMLPLFFIVGGVFAKIKVRHLVVFILGYSLLITPWIYRNSQLPSAGLFLSQGNLWPNLWMGTWMKTSNTNWYMTPNYLPPEASRTFDNGNSPDVLMDAWNKWDKGFFKKVVIEYVSNHPLEVIRTMTARHYKLWLGTRSELMTAYSAKGTLFWFFIKGSFYLISAAVIFLSLPGMLLALRSKELPMMFCMPILYTAIIYFPFHNDETRYSQPVMPILTIFSVYFILRTIEKFHIHPKSLV